MNSNKRRARIAGLFYLLVAIFGGLAFFVRSNLFVNDDAATTVKNIINSDLLFRVGIVSDLLGQIFGIFLVIALYSLLKTVNKNLAIIMVILLIVPVPITCLNSLNQIAVLLHINNPDFAKVFNPDQLQTQIMFFLSLNDYGIYIAQIFWGLWLFPLGYLIFKSDLIPKVIGILLIIAGSGYFIDSLGYLLSANYNLSIASFTFIGELILIFWLLIKGVKDRQPAVITVN